MGYDIHIHRRADWTDEGDDISVEEWRGVIANDPALEEDGCVDWATEEDSETVITPSAAVRGTSGVIGGFYWDRGRIVCKNPSHDVLAKAHGVATALNARVQGDDGEFYASDGSPIEENRPAAGKAPWWRSFFGRRQ
jgi:hypothetical protein